MNRAASLAAMMVAVFIGVAIVVTGRWYIYVAYAADPFDQVGVGLNMMMPGPVRDIGCAKLRQRLGRQALPPAGCGVDGSW